MNIKKILFIYLILMILSITAVSASDSDNINATDSVEPIQEIEPAQMVEHDTNLQPISEKKTVDLSNLKATSTSPGTFIDLQIEINNAEEGSVLVLTRDYNGHYGSRIHPNKDITIDGQGHTLNCQGERGGIAFYSITGNIVLKNIRIINGYNDLDEKGGAIHIEGSAKYTLENCIFENNWADEQGGAIYNSGDVLTIKNCIFNGNIADDESGGAIYSTKDVIIEESTFTNNKADNYGGAIFCSCTMTVNANHPAGPYSSFFNNNDADYSGGAIYAYDVNLRNAEFKDNTAQYGGGAVGSTNFLAASDCLFESNNVYCGSGGALDRTDTGNDTYLERCIFKSNTASQKGGAVHIDHKLYVDNCTFENNHAISTGGAIYAPLVYINTKQSENKAFNTYFIGNSLSDPKARASNGGAISALYGGKVVNTYFKDNIAPYEGGAIYVDISGTIGIDHCLFENNIASEGKKQCYGGAIRAECDVYIYNSTFKNNYAYDYGGAIYAINVRINHDRENETADTFFIDNKVKDNDGGAIYAKDDVFARNVAFINNAAYVDGGAIYVEKNVEVIRSTFESNQANGASVARCYGGAIHAEENAKINNCTFKNNYAENRGGAVYASTVTIEGGQSRFEGNSAKDYGGAIYAKDDVFARNVAFINNAAYVDGGAIYAGKNVEVIRSIFESNQATGASVARCYGGAIRAGENAKINNCTFKNNYADNRGGAVHASTVTIEGDQSRFEGNSAKDYGGAIYTDTFTNPVSHVSFINNKAEDGGVIYINNKNWIQFTDCVFINNQATNRGGAIYIDSVNSHLLITNNTFNGNRAADEGHTVFNCGYYDLISGNQWYIIPTTSNYQLIKWKPLSPNIHYIDSNPVVSPIETPTFPGTFDDLQIKINNAEDGSVLILTRDYTGHYGSRIHLDKDITIDGQGHTLNCLGEGGCSAFYSTSGNIVLKNILIKNGHNDYNDKGGALHIEGSAKYTLENCKFENNYADNYGGAIYNDGDVLTIKNCTFDKNRAYDESGGAIYSTKDVIIEGSKFINNLAEKDGGAIYCKGTLSVNMNQGTRPYNSFFDNNKVIKSNGGAIDASKIYLKNALFQDNSAFCDGGAVYSTAYFNATDCLFELNTVEYGGGAIYVQTTYNMDNNTYIKGCIFKSNTATKSSGAVEAHSDVFIDNCTFENNWAGSEAGALSAHTVYININQAENESYNTYFIGNSASNSEGRPNRGGAIYIENGGRIVNTYFKGNNAKVDGGAIYVEKSVYDHTYSNKINIDHCLFEGNSATGGAYQCYGGAICSESDVYIHNSTFKNNYAYDYGGAIYAKNVNINHDRECETTDTFFIDNKAKDDDGGAIYADNDVFTRNVAFISNTAYVDGGAIYAKNNVETRCCIFEGNSATGSTYQCYGGAICSESDVYIHNSTFKNNYADDYGGAIYAKNVRINHDRESETADTFFINNKVKDNDGGAIYAKDDVFARNVAFINNAAYVDGGAIYAGKNVEVIRSTFESNQATGAPSSRCYGGAIRAKENAKINDCTFKNNHADNRGGAVYASTVTTEGNQNTFEGNSAKDYGGAIYTDTFTGPVSHVSFINNSAEDGGAVYINKENWITFTDCIFIDNRAANKGGAIYLDSKNSHMTIVNNVFINNFAGKEGHTVFNSGHYDAISGNFWSMIPTEYNNQLVEWKATTSNVQHIDYYPVTFTIEIIGLCCANATSGVKISFVGPDGTSATLPMIAEYFSMSCIEGIEIGDKEVSADGITIWFTPTEVGTYELPAYIAGMNGIITINVIDGDALVLVPLPEQDIIIPDIPKPVIPPTKTTNLLK